MKRIIIRPEDISRPMGETATNTATTTTATGPAPQLSEDLLRAMQAQELASFQAQVFAAQERERRERERRAVPLALSGAGSAVGAVAGWIFGANRGNGFWGKLAWALAFSSAGGAVGYAAGIPFVKPDQA